ncbi:hypothetical protein RZS08_39455, partial [Arthrospira platensis SPKY1]|nr:hypothetical protein [Arthrospira platensis SPKY1]
RQVGDADVLDHPEGDDRVVGAGGVDVAVVAELDARPPGDPLALQAAADEVRLRLRDRHPVDGHVVGGGDVGEDRPPAAADVENPHAGAQPRLAADPVHLVALRHLE